MNGNRITYFCPYRAHPAGCNVTRGVATLCPGLFTRWAFSPPRMGTTKGKDGIGEMAMDKGHDRWGLKTTALKTRQYFATKQFSLCSLSKNTVLTFKKHCAHFASGTTLTFCWDYVHLLPGLQNTSVILLFYYFIILFKKRARVTLYIVYILIYIFIYKEVSSSPAPLILFAPHCCKLTK